MGVKLTIWMRHMADPLLSTLLLALHCAPLAADTAFVRLLPVTPVAGSMLPEYPT